MAATPIPPSELPRPSANFHPTIWGDRFLQYASESMEVHDKLMEEQIKVLKEEVRKKIVSATKKPITKIYLIDLIQRLGVNYHFESEINDVLQQIHSSILEFEQDLQSLALLFRLLRQQGYHISPDVFEMLKDENGNINKQFSTDVDGLLSLYEATQLRVHGEHLLEEALVFTSTQLELMIPHLTSSLASKVKRTLIKHPLHKSLPRLEAWHFISSYQQDPSHDQTLLAFAKMDFNMLQNLHQKKLEVSLSKWWKELDFARKLPFARDRVVEGYFWALGVYFEPCYSLARMITTKVMCMTSIIDDTYDAYGTFEQLQLFTKAIERWDIRCMDFLPEYMRFCYQALLDVYEEIERDMIKEERTFYVNYAKDEMKRLVQAYFVEAKWLNSNYTPTMKEYMRIAQISSGYRMLAATSFIGMRCVATEEAFQWIINDPKNVRASEIICRLMDDIVSNELEQKRGHVASALECYMKQHGVAKEEAIDELRKEVISAWKDMNEEWLHPTISAKPLLMRSLNLSRVIDSLYTDADGYTNSQGPTKDYIVALLLSPFHL